MAKRKTAAASPQGFPMELEFDDGSFEAGGGAAPKKDDSENPAIAALTAQINEIKSAHERELSELRNSQFALLQQPARAPQVQTELDVKGLPDPVEKPDEYARELSARMARVNEGKQALEKFNQSEAEKQRNRLNGVWEDFTKEFPAYAKNEKLVKFVAQDVLGDLTGRGIDANKYIFGNTKQFMRDVTSRMDDILGKPPALEGDEADEDSAADDHRTVGVFGGQQSGGKPAQAAQEEKDGGLFDDIRSFQVNNGFYR